VVRMGFHFVTDDDLGTRWLLGESPSAVRIDIVNNPVPGCCAMGFWNDMLC